MNKSSLAAALALLATLLIVAVVEAQKTYYISSINSNVYVAAGSCWTNVDETTDYVFTGSYSQVARAIPYSVASSIQTTSVKIDILTPGYTTATSVQSQNNAYFIATSIYPATPAGMTTTIRIRRSYTVSGPLTKSGNTNSISYYYQEATDINNLVATFNFDNGVVVSGNFTPSVGGVINGNKVTFTRSYVSPNSIVSPSVAFNAGNQFDSCSGNSILMIVIIVIVVIIFICCSIVCGIIGFFRRVIYGFFRGGSYGYVSDYPTGHHHHHHNHGSTYYSGGGNSNSGGVTGTSGYAN